LQFEVADARSFQLSEPVDSVFSNATLHWIKEPDSVIKCVYQTLKPGGHFVAEFGGKGNIQAIVQAMITTLQSLGYTHPQSLNPWYFPRVGDYATRLENHGFEVNYAILFDRPIPLEGGEAGMANWLHMFARGILSELTPEKQRQIIQSVERLLYPTLFQKDHWIADYRRLRVVAVKR
jgi:trans-aconitate methyltransferase